MSFGNHANNHHYFIQLNLNYPDSLGIDEIVWIIEGMSR